MLLRMYNGKRNCTVYLWTEDGITVRVGQNHVTKFIFLCICNLEKWQPDICFACGIVSNSPECSILFHDYVFISLKIFFYLAILSVSFQWENIKLQFFFLFFFYLFLLNINLVFRYPSWVWPVQRDSGILLGAHRRSVSIIEFVRRSLADFVHRFRYVEHRVDQFGVAFVGNRLSIDVIVDKPRAARIHRVRRRVQPLDHLADVLRKMNEKWK